MLKFILRVLTVLWIAFWLFIGVITLINTPNQIAKDKEFIEKNLKPSVNFIKKFKNNKHRLPTNREFYTWERDFYNDLSSDLNQKEDSLIPGLGLLQYIRNNSNIISSDRYKFKHADWTKDFALGVWNGAWEEYYLSWTDDYDCDNYTWVDGIINLIILSGIGFSPILFWFIYYKRKKKREKV